MTPAECRTGTVVMWADWVGVVQSMFNNGHKDHRARVSNWERVVPLALPDEVDSYNDQQPGETVDCEDLEFAPRFLVGGEWLVVAEQAQGSVWFANGRWEWSAVTPEVELVTGSATTYLAARQAVERACGVER